MRITGGVFNAFVSEQSDSKASFFLATWSNLTIFLLVVLITEIYQLSWLF